MEGLPFCDGFGRPKSKASSGITLLPLLRRDDRLTRADERLAFDDVLRRLESLCGMDDGDIEPSAATTGRLARSSSNK